MKNLFFVFIILISLSGCKKTITCECKGSFGEFLSTNEVEIKLNWSGGKNYDKGEDCWIYRDADTPNWRDTVTCIVK